MSYLGRTALSAALILIAAMPCHADDVYMGATLSAGPVVDKSGRYFDASMYGGLGLWLILGAEAKRVEGRNLNAAYAGVGLTGLLQAHIGASDQGAIYRLKSEFAPFALAREGTIYPTSKGNYASLNRVSVSLTYEDTFHGKGLGNLTLGLGYIFNWSGY